ncbi:MAG: hypothetical protein AB8F78_00740 [Saprospiraceae bacterium]
MTADRFGELLRKPALLSGQNATELEVLIASHPWSGPLRVLRYQKALLDNNAEDIRIWENRAAPFLDRSSIAQQRVALINTNPARADQHFGFLAPGEPPAKETLEITTDVEEEAETSGIEGVNTNTSDYDLAVLASVVETVDWYLHRHGLIMEYGRPKPAPKESFRSYNEWKRKKAKTSWRDLLLLSTDKKQSTKKSRKETSETSDETHEIASETLAEILALQGHSDKAIKMYETLSLRYPEKRATFAALIDALQQENA